MSEFQEPMLSHWQRMIQIAETNFPSLLKYDWAWGGLVYSKVSLKWLDILWWSKAVQMLKISYIMQNISYESHCISFIDQFSFVGFRLAVIMLLIQSKLIYSAFWSFLSGQQNILEKIGQYHCCWWHGDFCRQVISSHDIDWLVVVFRDADRNNLYGVRVEEWCKLWNINNVSYKLFIIYRVKPMTDFLPEKIDERVQHCSNSIANALEIPQSCAKLLRWCWWDTAFHIFKCMSVITICLSRNMLHFLYNIRYFTSVLIMHDISVIAFSMCYVKHKQELLISHAGMNVLINKTRFIHSVMNLYFYWKYHDSFHVNETRFTSSRAMEVFPHCLTPLWLTLNRWRGYLPPTPTPHPHPLPITKT